MQTVGLIHGSHFVRYTDRQCYRLSDRCLGYDLWVRPTKPKKGQFKKFRPKSGKRHAVKLHYYLISSCSISKIPHCVNYKRCLEKFKIWQSWKIIIDAVNDSATVTMFLVPQVHDIVQSHSQISRGKHAQGMHLVCSDFASANVLVSSPWQFFIFITTNDMFHVIQDRRIPKMCTSIPKQNHCSYVNSYHQVAIQGFWLYAVGASWKVWITSTAM